MKTRNVTISKLGFRFVGTMALAVPCLALAILPAWAETVSPDTASRLTVCLERAKIDADAAELAARDWAKEAAKEDSGAKAARAADLCRAVAQFHGGHFTDAAMGFEALAKSHDGGDANGIAALLGQAAWAWLRAKQPDTAITLYGEALEKRPDDAELLIDRAVAYAETERFWDAITDLTRANTLAPQRLEPLLYRAQAYKALGQMHLALGDANAALAAFPTDPQALLLRGNLWAESGNLAAAKADWEACVNADKADGPQGRLAAAALTRLPAQALSGAATRGSQPSQAGKP